MTAQVTAQVAAIRRDPQPANAIMAELGLKHWKTFQTSYLVPLMAMGILRRSIPDKPRSRAQREATKVAHYYLAVNAMTKPMKVRQDSPPYEGDN